LYILEKQIKELIAEGLAAKEAGGGGEKEEAKGSDLMAMMSFANGGSMWCKCCPVPGTPNCPERR
jgi:hypothetical protein